MSETPLLECRGVSKAFGAVQALYRVDFEVRRGEVMALVGDNGAGKSTLIKGIAGIHPFDEGEIRFEGEPVRIHGPRDAAKLGIEVVYQDLALADNLDVVANMFLGRERTRWGFVLDESKMEHAARETLEGLSVTSLRSVRQTVAGLSGGQRQAVAVAKSVLWNSLEMILDEPTAALGPHEIQSLFQMIRRVVAGGVSILYISHKLEEVLEIADRVTVLRDGRLIGTVEAKGTSRIELIRMMVGREVLAPQKQTRVELGNEILQVTEVGRGKVLDNISFYLREGEILGIFGLLGAGQKQLIDALYGLRPASRGTICVGGKPVRVDSPQRAKQLGFGLVPDDRKREGLVLALSVSA
ncbi:MAG: sugar ABC transporter ATP-binding protein, partial [Aeromicrobium sp.]